MKKILFIIAVIGLLSSCKTGKDINGTPKTSQNVEASSGEEGASYENPIIIKEKTESTGVAAEYTWIRKNYPGSKTGSQSLTQHKGKYFDIIEITTADGQKKRIYFDISNYFGKF